MNGLWALAKLDLLLWRRMPLAAASALIPPIGMALLLVILSLTVTTQPVALVVQSHGPLAAQMEKLLTSDKEAFALTETDPQTAAQMLADQRVVAIITIPADFDQDAAAHTAALKMTLNNIDIDFADDLRRSIERAAGQFDAPNLGLGEVPEGQPQRPDRPNPYRIDIHESEVRDTDVDFLHYQVLPVLVLLVLNVGLMGTALLCARDAEGGTARMLVVAPVSSWALVAGRLLGGMLASLAVLFVAVVFCVLTRIIAPPAAHWPALILLFVATALCASGLGAILGTVLRGTRIIALASSLVATYLFFLGGGFTTIAFLPTWIRDISALNPIRYAIDGMRQALFYPDLTGLPLDIAILTATAVGAVVIGSMAVRRSWSA